VLVDGATTKAPGGGEVAGRSPVDRGKQGLKRSGMKGKILFTRLQNAVEHRSAVEARSLTQQV
jgi:hypothetical protein